jgi:hypothetical protein
MDEGTEALLRYIDQLERAILVAAEEAAGGDPRYGLRVISCMADRIKMANEAAEAAAAEAARQRLH